MVYAKQDVSILTLLVDKQRVMAITGGRRGFMHYGFEFHNSKVFFCRMG
jgi:hypothetical protein